MPANPADFRFAGVDGRGGQTLVRDPRNNRGTAVVEIEDPDSGAEGYTFDLFWGSGPDYSSGFQGDRGDRNDRGFTPPETLPGNPGDRNDRGFRPPDNRPGAQGGFRGGRRMTEEEALDVCRRSVREQAADQFRNPNIDIRNIAIDNNPGRRDWITGDLFVRRRFGRDHVYRFSCSVNFDTGLVRSTHVDQFEENYYPNRRY